MDLPSNLLLDPSKKQVETTSQPRSQGFFSLDFNSERKERKKALVEAGQNRNLIGLEKFRNYTDYAR